jgi:hypothetical protein
MPIDEIKYENLFLQEFKANKTQLKSEFKRIIAEHGNTEEIKLEFYIKLFQLLIAQFKKEVTKDENFEYIITTLYNSFIQLLKTDGIDASQIEKELHTFRTTELSDYKIVQSVNQFQPSHKQYNLNSKYGRRKAREQAQRNYDNGTTEYKREIDSIRFVVWLIIGGIALLIYLIKANS